MADSNAEGSSRFSRLKLRTSAHYRENELSSAVLMDKISVALNPHMVETDAELSVRHALRHKLADQVVSHGRAPTVLRQRQRRTLGAAEDEDRPLIEYPR